MTFKIKKDSLHEFLMESNFKSCTVIRGGKKKQIDPKKLVIGDLVEIKAGEKIPADLRIT
jgi:sodium/potassium-transporting ATPase subunit alpha